MFNNKIQEKTYKAYVIIAIFSLFLAIMYQVVFNTLHVFVKEYNYKLQSITRHVEMEIVSMNKLMYSLSIILSYEKIEKSNPRIEDLLNNYVSWHVYKTVPFHGLRIWDINDRIIFNNLFPIENSSITEKDKYFKNANKNPFELEIGEIHFGRRSKKEVLPLSIVITDRKQKYAGILCFSVLVNDITEPLIDVQKYNNIKLVNQPSVMDPVAKDHINEHQLIAGILKYYLQNKPLILFKPLTHYPIVVTLEINSSYLGKEIMLALIYCLGYFCIFAALMYYLLTINQKKYQKPFYDINQRALDLQLKIMPNIIDVNNKPKTEKLNNFCPNDLVKAMESIIDYCNLLYTNAEKHTLQQSSAELHNSILHVILTERHYHPSNKNTKTNVSALYLEQLRRIINEKDQSIILPVFLRDIIEYCSVYYNDLDIKIQISKKDHKAFAFKKAALTEAIFHIFSLITRIGKFDTDNEEVIVSDSFVDRNPVPTINIEVNLCNSSLQSMGWELGTNYVYSGLLSIYLLAKENNLFFHLEQKKQKIIFILEPIDNQRLKNISGDSLNLKIDSAK